MRILDIYKVQQIDFKDKTDLIIYNSSGVVQSKKYFPIYSDKIFKPLSKTKPYTTPLFAYSEVFWSYYIKKYFEKNAPQYSLAICSGIEKEIPKNYEIGTLVPIVTEEKLVNLLEFYKEYPDKLVNIDDYVNYCEKIYSYKNILDSDIFQKRKDLRQTLEIQILLSILKQDENFHYENISFIVKENKIVSLCPTLDSEFSLMFLFPDDELHKKERKLRHKESLNIPFSKKTDEYILNMLSITSNFTWKANLENIVKIVELDVEVVIEFLEKLDLFIEDIESTDVLFYNDNFFDKLNSDSWKIGHARYKNNDELMANLLEQELIYKEIEEKEFNEKLKQECIESAKYLKYTLQVLLIAKEKELLNNLTIKECLDIDITKDEYDNLSIDEKLELVSKQKVKKY